MTGTDRSARAGSPAVHSLEHFALTVPDLGVAAEFYTAFGLRVRDDAGTLALHTDDTPHRWGSVSEGPAKRLAHLSFGAYTDDLPAFDERLRGMGVLLPEPPPGVDGPTDGLWFRDPDGAPLQIRAAPKSSPDLKSPVSNPTSPPGRRWAPLRDEVAPVRPRRLQHVLVFTRDVDRAIRFYGDTLGVRLSDRSGDVAFMHGVHGSDHHMIAFAKSDHPGFHHCSWDVPSVHAVGVGAMQMADSGYHRGWGLGQHVLGSNYFHYVRDPWGSYSEYSCGMDYIPGDLDWVAHDHHPDNGFYLWGPVPPADFARNLEVAS